MLFVKNGNIIENGKLPSTITPFSLILSLEVTTAILSLERILTFL